MKDYAYKGATLLGSYTNYMVLHILRNILTVSIFQRFIYEICSRRIALGYSDEETFFHDVFEETFLLLSYLIPSSCWFFMFFPSINGLASKSATYSFGLAGQRQMIAKLRNIWFFLARGLLGCS